MQSDHIYLRMLNQGKYFVSYRKKFMKVLFKMQFRRENEIYKIFFFHPFQIDNDNAFANTLSLYDTFKAAL